MRWVLAVACASSALAHPLAAQLPSAQRGRAELRELVAPDDPLVSHDLGFDASEARQALAYVRNGDPALLAAMAASPAIAHVLAHARIFDYDVPRNSGIALVRGLLGTEKGREERTATCQESLAYFSGPMLADPRWVDDALAYLPPDFRFRGTLFLTFGYDIGVALAPNASLNCSHSHFSGQPRELLYYAIHELHHAGFMTYQHPPRVADLKTCRDLLRLVEYSTQMEGMAVLAAYERRRDEHALGGDADYVALVDKRRMQEDLAAYSRDYAFLESRATLPADVQAWQVIDRMSSGERLWYRVGAYMAQRIEVAQGREALVGLIRQGPAAFLAAYRSIAAAPVGANGAAATPTVRPPG